MITAMKNEEGVWLRFTTKGGGKEALILVSKIVKGSGPIVSAAVEECAAEMLELETQHPTAAAAPCAHVFDSISDSSDKCKLCGKIVIN